MTDFYKIIEYDEYGLTESVSLVKARFFKIENGVVSVWFEDNETQALDLYINANDVLAIKRIEEEEK